MFYYFIHLLTIRCFARQPTPTIKTFVRLSGCLIVIIFPLSLLRHCFYCSIHIYLVYFSSFILLFSRILIVPRFLFIKRIKSPSKYTQGILCSIPILVRFATETELAWFIHLRLCLVCAQIKYFMDYFFIPLLVSLIYTISL